MPKAPAYVAICLVFVSSPKYMQFIVMGGVVIAFGAAFIMLESYRAERLKIWLGPKQSQFFTDNGKNHIVLRLRHKTQLLHTGAQSFSKQTSGTNRIIILGIAICLVFVSSPKYMQFIVMGGVNRPPEPIAYNPCRV